MNCQYCNESIEDDAKFCIHCGKEVSSDIVIEKEKSKDLPWYFLIISFLVGIPGGINNMKSNYEATADLSILEYLSAWSKVDSIPPEFYAEMIGGSLFPVLLSSIVIGFIWGVKSMMSKKYDKPIQSIFISSLILSIISFIAVSQ